MSPKKNTISDRFSEKTASTKSAGESVTRLDFGNSAFFIGAENTLIETAIHWILYDMTVNSCTDSDFTVACPIVLLYGPAGVGKSHLLSGIFQKWHEIHSRKKSIFLTGEGFARSLVTAITSKTTEDFRRKFQKADLMIFDDLHLIQDKEAARIELLTILDGLDTARQRMVLGMDTFPSPKMLKDERLIARLTSGFVVPMVFPGYSARTAILSYFAEQSEMTLPPKFIPLLAKSLSGSVPQLQGVISKLAFESERQQITLPLIQTVLREFADHYHSTVTVDEIAKQVARQMGLKLSEMKSKSRKSTTVLARGIAMYLSRQRTKLSLKEIGQYFGGRDHTTVSHSIQNISEQITQSPQYRDLLLKIQESLSNRPL
ncbi:MAG: AAA family ATPase [Planctomycetaceae bacterium]|nr:AAA family ATPase [Planctomycetaceae bacterium]